MPTEFLQAYIGATDEQRRAALDALQGRTAAGLTSGEPIPRILSAEAVAELTGLDKRSLRSYAAKGQLQRAYFGGEGKRAKGYTEESVRRFISAAGGAANTNERGNGKGGAR